MILIAGSAKISPGKMEEAQAAIREMLPLVHKEPGCEVYRFSIDAVDSNLLHLFERWTTEEALAAHFETPHFQAFFGVISGMTEGEMEVTRFDVSGARPLFG